LRKIQKTKKKRLQVPFLSFKMTSFPLIFFPSQPGDWVLVDAAGCFQQIWSLHRATSQLRHGAEELRILFHLNVGKKANGKNGGKPKQPFSELVMVEPYGSANNDPFVGVGHGVGLVVFFLVGGLNRPI